MGGIERKSVLFYDMQNIGVIMLFYFVICMFGGLYFNCIFGSMCFMNLMQKIILFGVCLFYLLKKINNICYGYWFKLK